MNPNLHSQIAGLMGILGAVLCFGAAYYVCSLFINEHWQRTAVLFLSALIGGFLLRTAWQYVIPIVCPSCGARMRIHRVVEGDYGMTTYYQCTACDTRDVCRSK